MHIEYITKATSTTDNCRHMTSEYNAIIHLQNVRKLQTNRHRYNNLHTNLSYCTVFSKYVVHIFSSNLVWQIFNIQDSVHFWRQSNLYQKQIHKQWC